ncbi:MAG: MBOAT family O-acyltransferase, partial [Bacteroidota bacterium]
YIPLGGNRVSKRRMYFNLWVVFLFSGLWHGASWNFVIFGAFHGAFIVMERGVLKKFYQKIGRVGRIIFTYMIVLISWVFFRQTDLGLGIDYILRMFSFQFHADLIGPDAHVVLLMIMGLLFAFAGISQKIEEGVDRLYNSPKSLAGYGILSIMTLFLGIASITELFAADFNPFIYFRF